MSKSQFFTIYLLKEGYAATKALEEGHDLQGQLNATRLPSKAVLYVLDAEEKQPWWRGYFGITKSLLFSSKGAIVFLPVKGRWFALCFGHVYHNLREASYEHDFGLTVTLNSVDPGLLKSTDTLEPGAARRRRTQVPMESDLTFFDFDRDSTILTTLTGKVRDEHKELFRHATGAANLRISSAVGSDDLAKLCEKLLVLYDSDEYKTTFPDIQNIKPVHDPVVLAELDAKLIASFRAKDSALNLIVPDLINYEDDVYAAFAGAGTSKIYEDVFMGRYYDYLEDHAIELTSIGIEDLKAHRLLLTDGAGVPHKLKKYSIYKSIIFDTSTTGSPDAYHMCDGNWYQVDKSFAAKLKTYLDPRWTEIDLPAYAHASEGDYNQKVAKPDELVCLDTESISPNNQTAVEPCDLYSAKDGIALFIHVKRSTLSAQLSHLFNQGTNAIELLRGEPQSVDRLRALIKAEVSGGVYDQLVSPLATEKHRVLFAIISRKDKSGKSENLPLFSRISLARNIKALRLMGVDGTFGFISDASPASAGVKKQRKKKIVAAAQAVP